MTKNSRYFLYNRQKGKKWQGGLGYVTFRTSMEQKDSG